MMVGATGAIVEAFVAQEPSRTAEYREDEVTEPGRPRIVAVRGLQGLLPLELEPGRHVVGRDEQADVTLVASGVSRKHARLSVGIDADVEIVDLGSRNGTFVNGQRVDRVSLRDGDELRFGEAVVRIEWVGRVGPARTAMAPTPRRPPELSEREYEVAGLVAEGLTNAEIGRKLHISPATVGRHLSNVYARLGIHSRAALAKLVTSHR